MIEAAPPGGGRDPSRPVRQRDPRDDLLDLDEALAALARQEPLKAELVKLRYFAGLSVDETAACLGISPVTAKRHWAVARAWLYAALSDDEVTGPGRKKLRQGDPAST